MSQSARMSAAARSGRSVARPKRSSGWTPKSSKGKPWRASELKSALTGSSASPTCGETRSSKATPRARAMSISFSGLGYFRPFSISER